MPEPTFVQAGAKIGGVSSNAWSWWTSIGRPPRGLGRVDAYVETRRIAQVGVVLVGVAVATVTLLVVDADFATATLVLLAVVVLAARYGRLAVVLASASAFLALNWYFTNPHGQFGVDKVEDLVPLLAFALAGAACSVHAARHDLRPVVAVAAVGASAALLVVTDADLVVAALFLLGVVVVTAVMGLPTATTAVVASYIALNYWFTPPIESLEITKGQDLVPLFAFTVAAAASVATVTRVSGLRQRAATTEARAFEALVAQATSDNRAAFLASMTHNLRTPLASIKAAVATLLASPDGDLAQRIRLLSLAHAEAERLERLVTKVLQLARIHSGALEPSPEPVDLVEMAGRAARRLHHLAGERGLRVVVRGDLVVASVDPDMLELVFIVLLENALRFAPAGSEIEVVVTAPSDRDAVIRVVDHGPGIPAGQREEVFGEFVQLDPAGGGSGLGLTIARSMIEAHGGRIGVEETVGGGTTMVVSVPSVVASVRS
jgi:two-component system sensor histidine kinase KdpD